MQPYNYPELGLSITPGPGPDTSDDLVHFNLAGTHEPVRIANDLTFQPAGIRACATSIGIKPDGQPDFTVVTLPQPGPAAAVFSQSRCPSDTVLRGRKCLANGQLQAVAVSSGNANVYTPDSASVVARIATLVSDTFQVDDPDVLLSLTGVIGVPLPLSPFEHSVPHLTTALQEQNLDAAAKAILT